MAKIGTIIWNSKKVSERNLMDWLGNQLGFKEMDDWYGVTVKQIHENGGSGLFEQIWRLSFQVGDGCV